MFLRPELLIDSNKIKPLAEAISKLGYQVIPTAKNYQFAKPGPGGSPAGIKIDILTGPQACFNGTSVKTDTRRAKPQPSVGIHAHHLDEALTLEEELLPIRIKGNLSSGNPGEAEAYLPHPFTFLMMKLFAFKDRLNDDNREFGSYHALDLYTIMATMMENEWDTALELRNKHKDEPFIVDAGNLVSQYFSALNGLGMIRLRESTYFRSEFQLDEFMSALSELFPVKVV